MSQFFKLYFDKHRTDNLVWEITYYDVQSHKSVMAHYSEVFISVPIRTIYLGKYAEEPKAVIKGKYDVLRTKGTKLYIT